MSEQTPTPPWTWPTNGRSPTDKELSEILPTLPMEQRIETVIRKYVGGALSYCDGETPAPEVERRMTAHLMKKLRPWLNVTKKAEKTFKVYERLEDHSKTLDRLDPADIASEGHMADTHDPQSSSALPDAQTLSARCYDLLERMPRGMPTGEPDDWTTLAFDLVRDLLAALAAQEAPEEYGQGLVEERRQRLAAQGQ